MPEQPRSGEVIERDEFSTGQVRVAICSACGTKFQYVPDSDWLKVIFPWNAKPPTEAALGITISTVMTVKP